MTIFDRRNETMRPDLVEQVQLERLQALLARLRRNVRRYAEAIGDTQIQSLADVVQLPFTTPDDLVSAFPYGMFALPLREVIRLHSNVGPGGKQLVCGYTNNDLIQWGRLTARQLVAAGVTSNDVLQIGFGDGFLAHSLGFMLGAELIESSVIPEDTSHIEYQLEVLESYRTTVLITTPTNATDLVELLRATETDAQSLHLHSVILTRPVSPDLREDLETGLFARVQCCFGIPEITNPGFCVECKRGRFHVNEDHFLVEVQDGELVVTTLCREAMPLLRYRTRVACSLQRGKCSCGRTGTMVTPGGRLDGQLRVREMPLYEGQVKDVLAKTEAAGQPFLLEISDTEVTISIEMSQRLFGDQMRLLADLREQIRSEFRTRLGIPAVVRYVAPASVSVGEGRLDGEGDQA